VSLDEQADRVGGARRVLVCSSGQPERAISASGRWVLKDLPSEVRFGRFRAKRGPAFGGPRQRANNCFVVKDANWQALPICILKRSLVADSVPNCLRATRRSE
jgi:hypothetical protein